MARVGVLFELENVRGLEALLEKASSVIRESVARANRETAFAVMNRAKANAPRDRGDLQASISAQPRGRNGNWVVGILDRTIPSRGGHNTAHLNPWVYGVWYEYGFVTRNIAAHPFMRPAAAAEAGAHQTRIAAAIHTVERLAA